MVVQYLSAETCLYETSFRLPRETSGFQRGYTFNKNQIIFFYSQKDDHINQRLNHYLVPEDAREVEFRKMTIGRDYFVGEPKYYNYIHNTRNLLKEGNR